MRTSIDKMSSGFKSYSEFFTVMAADLYKADENKEDAGNGLTEDQQTMLNKYHFRPLRENFKQRIMSWFLRNLCLPNEFSKSIADFANSFIEKGYVEVYSELSKMQNELRDLEEEYYMYTYERPNRPRIVALAEFNAKS